MKGLLALMLAVLGVTTVFSQQKLGETLEVYSKYYNQERCYLHYDKSSYAPGETIWFKSYLMSGILPADDSKTFYVDWTDDKGNLLAHNAHPIVEATAFGDFQIPGDYTGNYIHVKAYTKWMLNFDSAFIYHKDIKVLMRKNIGSVSRPAVVPTLEFFPEGGDAVQLLSNKIAFKAADQWGRPVTVRGAVYNNKGEKQDTIITQHDGMGYFFLTPLPGETYTARWKDEKGKKYSTSLPPAKENGIVLRLGLNGPKRIIAIQAQPGQEAVIDSVHIIGTMNQNLVFQVSKQVKTNDAGLSVPTKDLPSGILTITVFNKTWSPLAERITYINNEEYRFTPEMEVQHWGLSKRARNEVKIAIPDSIVANLSVSVTDVAIDNDNSSTIIDYLMLTSDLKGTIHNPVYYFSKDNDTISRHLDLVMLTHGWRRFQWEKIVANKFPNLSYARDTNYLSLSGNVYGVTPTQLRDAGDIILFVKPRAGEIKTVVLPVEKNGTFVEPSLVIFDSVSIYYQFLNKKMMGDAMVQFLGNLLPPFTYQTGATGLYFNQSADTTGHARHFRLADEAAELSKYEGKILSNVIVKSKIKSPLEVMNEKYSSALFRNNDGYQFDLVNDFRTGAVLNIFQFLQGKVPGMEIRDNGGTPSITWRRENVQLYVDEMRADASLVSSIPVSQVAYIKVMRPPFFGGGGPGGAIAIYTRKGSDIESTPGKGLASNLVKGYTAIRQFYSPNYSSFKPEHEKKDIRTTIYWNPQVVLDPQKKTALLVFYNNDVTKAFRVIIEGITRDGRLAHIEQLME